MKLRNRFALSFAAASLGMLIASRLATIESFRRLQEYQLDTGLRARAREEGNEVALLGRKALELEYAEQEETDPLEQLVTYGALYRTDGSLVADTPSFAQAPLLGQVGMPPKRTPGTCFDFQFRGKSLRGVMVEVASPETREKQYLLLAASRRGLDTDAQELLAVGWWVVVASFPLALAIGWLLGRRMTRGLEELAKAAEGVRAGDLTMSIAPGAARDEEVSALGRALREMVIRLKALIETERRFASHAAHELRSPLTALRGELELALRRKRSVEEYEGSLQEALEETNRLVDLAEDLLVVARIESGVADDPDEEVEVGDVVRDAIAASIGRTHGEVPIVVEAEPVTVRGADVALVRMVRNLVDNAIGHGGADPSARARIHVKCVEKDGARWARVEVEDDGPGVAVEDRERVFEPFHRGADARQEHGAGLGLGIAREIARRHGGDVVMESPARPTRFVVMLPAITRSPRASLPPPR